MAAKSLAGCIPVTLYGVGSKLYLNNALSMLNKNLA